MLPALPFPDREEFLGTALRFPDSSESLPYMRRFDARWFALSTGDPDLDHEIGRLKGLAVCKLHREYQGDPRDGGDVCGLISLIFDMIKIGRRESEQVAGFLLVVERFLGRALHSEPGWADPSAELDARSWPWFGQEFSWLQSLAPCRYFRQLGSDGG